MTTEGQIRNTADLGRLLRAYRKSRGLSQVDAAALAGVGERFLSELERGKPTAEIGLVFRVLDRFGLTLVLATRSGGNLLDERS
ncbi:MAG: helix-turn-helix transcriptional regulator [Gemmatimonadetes bacterium]|nr:helix-turn-helix transcriptional regulator [Gemmatimonadota bacterium]